MSIAGNQQHRQNLDGIILMGPFGAGKSYLGHALRAASIAAYTELEPIVYDRFDTATGFNLEQATRYLRDHYYTALSSGQELVAFESTGMVQRPLLLDVMEAFNIALIRVCTPKEICLKRVAQRNLTSDRPVALPKAAEFFDYWTNEIAPAYHFALEVDGTDAKTALQAIKWLKETHRWGKDGNDGKTR